MIEIYWSLADELEDNQWGMCLYTPLVCRLGPVFSCLHDICIQFQLICKSSLLARWSTFHLFSLEFESKYENPWTTYRDVSNTINLHHRIVCMKNAMTIGYDLYTQQSFCTDNVCVCRRDGQLLRVDGGTDPDVLQWFGRAHSVFCRECMDRLWRKFTCFHIGRYCLDFRSVVFVSHV